MPTSAEVIHYITSNLQGIDVVEGMGYTFFFYDPDRKLPKDGRFPFATIATEDNEHDRVSDLSRPGVYRLNIGIPPETFRKLLGPPAKLGAGGIIEGGHDFTTLDRIMPHPHYAPQSFMCILNPSEETWQTQVQPLLREAYDLAVHRYNRAHAS